MTNSGTEYRNRTDRDTIIARQALASLRASQSHNMSLKKAVRNGLVTIELSGPAPEPGKVDTRTARIVTL